MLLGDLNVPVRTLTTGGGVWVRPLATLAGAARLMAESTIGLLLVENGSGGALLGVISERDIVRAIASGADVMEERVQDWMTEDVLSLAGEAAVRDAAYALLEAEVRHLVIIDEDWPAGVVSERDILAAAMATDAAEHRSLLG